MSEPEKASDTVPHNATDPDALSTTQERALAALLAGMSVTDAAAAARVDRTTLHRWLKDDYGFQAELNRERRLHREAMQARLTALAARAVQNVEASVAAGDCRTSLAVLRAVGVLSPPRNEDPQDLLWQGAMAEWDKLDREQMSCGKGEQTFEQRRKRSCSAP